MKVKIKVLLLACGDIGLRLAAELLSLSEPFSFEIVAVCRKPEAKRLPVSLIGDGRFNWLALDLTKDEQVAQLPLDVDIVLYTPAPKSRDISAYEQLYGVALQNLLEYFLSKKCRRLASVSAHQLLWLQVSSTSVYGQHLGEWVDESSIVEPSKPSAKLIVAAENGLLSVQDSHIKPCIVRFAGIYGQERNWMFRRVLAGEAFRRNPPFYTNRIHIEDCVGFLRHLMMVYLARSSQQSIEPLYVACDSDPAPEFEVASWIAESLKRPAPTAAESTSGLSSEHKVGKTRLFAPHFSQNKRCLNALVLASGYQLRFPSYREGYRTISEKMLDQMV